MTENPLPVAYPTDHNDDEARLTEVWSWLCQTRRQAPANADIWDLRFRWSAEKTAFLAALQAGTYRLSPMLVVGRKRRAMWSARDALALKWVALSLVSRLALHPACTHVKGHGGGLRSVHRLATMAASGETPWVCRTDIKGYYGALNKRVLLAQLNRLIRRPALRSLLTQYVHYSVEDGGEFITPSRGIARGCALSPLMGALHLWALDAYFARQRGIRYLRYMDDFVLLAKSRWALRRQVKALNTFLTALGFEKHPDKTFIGRVSRGFDWLGAWLTHRGVVGIAPRAWAKHREKVRRLYEQTRRWLAWARWQRVSAYRRRWKIWVKSIVSSNTDHTGSEFRYAVI